MVKHADRFAAVPSLHMAWTMWVGVELARVKAKRWVQWLNVAHILLTLYVILATANHFLVDAVAAVPFVVVPVYIAERIAHPCPPACRARRLLPLRGDARRPAAACGVIMLDTPRARSGATTSSASSERLPGLPRFRQRLHRRGRWRRPVWHDHDPVDWEWHVAERHVDGMAGCARPSPRCSRSGCRSTGRRGGWS